jgi:preprotein translocase subunit SecF
VQSAQLTVADAREVCARAGVDEPIVQDLPAKNRIRVQVPAVSPETSTKIQNALAEKAGVAPTQVDRQQVSASWGAQIARRALTGLAVFFVAVLIYLAAAFDLKMAAAAFASLIHDVFITIGVYSLVGFTVTPATVIGVLTILGYSLYDTVVVFDKVRENTRGLLGTAKQTYSRRRTWPSTKPWCGHQHGHDLSRSRRSCSSAPGSRRRVLWTSRWRCSSASRSAPTPPSSSPPRCWLR